MRKVFKIYPEDIMEMVRAKLKDNLPEKVKLDAVVDNPDSSFGQHSIFPLEYLEFEVEINEFRT